jgi:hypothetical protein
VPVSGGGGRPDRTGTVRVRLLGFIVLAAIVLATGLGAIGPVVPVL